MEVRVQSPFPFEALPRVWRWIEGFRHKVSDDFSPKTLDEFVLLMASNYDSEPGYTKHTRKTWAIYGDGELGGLVTFEKLTDWAGTAHLVIKPDFQGKGAAGKALRITFAEIFALGIGRIVLYALEGNVAVGSLFVSLGGKREGCLRGHTLQGGKPIDVWVYGLSKSEFEEKSNAVLGRNIARVDRGGGVDRGLASGGETEDVHLHPDEHAHVDAGPAKAHRPTAAL